MNSKAGPARKRWPVFVLFCFLVGLFALEAGLRLVLGGTLPPRFFRPDERFGHFHVEGRSGWLRTSEYVAYTAINQHGLRDRDYTYEKPEGVFRILVLGDSFAEGLHVGMEECFASRLELMLNTPGGRPVEVINAGVSRYGTDNSLLFLEIEGLRYQPDLVLYAFYPNDVTDNVESGLFRLEDGEAVQQPIRIGLGERLRAALYDVSFIYRVGLGIVLRVRQQDDPTLIRTDWGLILPIYRQNLLPREEEAWVLTAALLNRMQADTADASSRLLVVYLPEIQQVDDAIWSQVDNNPPEPLDRDAPRTRLVTLLSPDTLFLDLTPGFRAAALHEELYYPVDRHFNPAGHARAAELIYEYIRAQNLIPPESALH